MRYPQCFVKVVAGYPDRSTCVAERCWNNAIAVPKAQHFISISVLFYGKWMIVDGLIWFPD